MGKAGGSVRQRTNKTGGMGRVWESPGRHSRIRSTGGVEGEAPGLGRAGWHPNLSLAN